MGASPELAGLLAGLTVLMLALGSIPAFVRHRELAARLDAAVAAGEVVPDHGGRRRARTRPRHRVRGPLGWLERRIERTGLDVTPAELVGAILLAALAGAVAGLVWQGALGAVAGAPAGAALPLLWLRRSGSVRQARFRAQLPDTIAMLASSVRAGHGLPQALEQVATDSPDPTRTALQQAVREIGLGASQEEALARLSARFPSEDLDLVTSAMDVQHQVGGSLSKVLDDIAATMRERVRIDGDIRALTAQQRYSAYVLALLPVFVAIGLFAVSRDYAELLLRGVLRYAVAAAALMVVIGFFLMRKIATVDV